MVFSSLYFLFLYLPIVLFLYYITPLKWRNLLLLLVNLVFYAWGEPVYILIMFLSIGIDYTHGMLVEKYKRRATTGGPGGRLPRRSSSIWLCCSFQVLGLRCPAASKPSVFPSCRSWA